MDYDRYKLFVGGIAKETNEEALKQHFSRYGVVLGVVVAKEKVTGQPRGFGFVRFANDSDVVKALRNAHFILGRAVDVKKAIRKDEHLSFQQSSQCKLYEGKMQQNNCGLYEMSNNGNNNRNKKIFVGGLSSNTTEEEFKTYFEKFGRTTDVVVMHDGVTNRPRGFGFVTFDSEDSVKVVMQRNFHELSDKRVEVKRAIPKDRIQDNNSNHNSPPTTYNSFQATLYVPKQNGYGMLVQQYPLAFGYHQGVQGFPYPYGYQFATQVPWNNPIMQPTGFYCPTLPLPLPPYMNGFDLSGMSIVGYNVVPWPLAGDAADAFIPRFEDLKLDVPSQAHQTMNGGGNMGMPLQYGTYR